MTDEMQHAEYVGLVDEQIWRRLGKYNPTRPQSKLKQPKGWQRNKLCPCGGPRKFKHCCWYRLGGK